MAAPWNLDHTPPDVLLAALADRTGVDLADLRPCRERREPAPRIGVQLAADHGREDALLAVAAQVERTRSWKDETPTL